MEIATSAVTVSSAPMWVPVVALVGLILFIEVVKQLFGVKMPDRLMGVVKAVLAGVVGYVAHTYGVLDAEGLMAGLMAAGIPAGWYSMARSALGSLRNS